MKLPVFFSKLFPGSRRIPPEVVTALSQLQAAIDTLTASYSELEKFAKETRTRTETVYRKVYRDIEKGNGDSNVRENIEEWARSSLLKDKVIRPGDSPPQLGDDNER